METFKGKSVFKAIAIGTLYVYEKKERFIKRYHVEDADAEIDRFQRAKEDVHSQLDNLYQKALGEVGETNAMIFQVHQMMLDDLDYVEAILNIIKSQEVNAEFAVATITDNFAHMFEAMEDEYMRERAADVKDVSERLLNQLQGKGGRQATLDEPSIILAEDLAPSETVGLDKEKVLAFITKEGSTNSHTAILARTMNIPAVIQVDMEVISAYQGKTVIVDGFHGMVYVDPEKEVLEEFKEKQKEEAEKKELLFQLKGKENITLDGQRVKVYANIGSVGDLMDVLKYDAGGIGLFRSEFLYLEKTDYPSENEQFNVYKKVLETMAGKKVIIRTLDIGADKQIDYFHLDKEENPAMGYRAIRICLDRKDVFKTQLRALYRASVYGTLSIMFPMIISVDEVKEVRVLIEEVKKELDGEGIPYEEVEIGLMVETPAAVMVSDTLAKEVDFLSIGTNDLTQYTLAIDRQNQKLDKIFDPYHPAVLQMIRMVAENAHKNGIWVGICGELAADLKLTETFLKIGIDELSVSPPFVLSLRKKIRETDVSKISTS